MNHPATPISMNSSSRDMIFNIMEENEACPSSSSIATTNNSIKSNNNASFLEKPRRALTAYNIYFQTIRQEILLEQDQLLLDDDNDKRRQQQQQQQQQRSDFTSTAKTVAAMWKQLSAREKAYYQDLAEQDQQRYAMETALWNKAKRAVQGINSTVQILLPNTSTTTTATGSISSAKNNSSLCVGGVFHQSQEPRTLTEALLRRKSTTVAATGATATFSNTASAAETSIVQALRNKNKNNNSIFKLEKQFNLSPRIQQAREKQNIAMVAAAALSIPSVTPPPSAASAEEGYTRAVGYNTANPTTSAATATEDEFLLAEEFLQDFASDFCDDSEHQEEDDINDLETPLSWDYTRIIDPHALSPTVTGTTKGTTTAPLVLKNKCTAAINSSQFASPSSSIATLLVPNCVVALPLPLPAACNDRTRQRLNLLATRMGPECADQFLQLFQHQDDCHRCGGNHNKNNNLC